jgi:tetratricopeptide (TPR) repeat protein
MSKKDMDTSLAEVINDTGVAYDKLGEHDKAVECYTKSLELELDYSVVFNRGEAYYKAKKFDLAEMDFTTIVESSESKDDILGARYGRALSRMQKGEVDQAVVDFSANIKEDPGCADSMYGRAFALARKGEASYTAAIRDCMAALDVRPAMMSARRLLLRLCAGRDEPDLGSWLTRARLHEIIEWIRREMILVQVAPLDPESEATLREMDLTGVDILTLSGDGSPNTLRQRLHNGGLRLGVAHDVQKAIRAALARSSARADPAITRESILGDTIQGRLVLGPELKVPSSRSGKDKEREKDKEKEKKRKADAESSAKNSKTNSTKKRKRDKDSRRMPEDESS